MGNNRAEFQRSKRKISQHFEHVSKENFTTKQSKNAQPEIKLNKQLGLTSKYLYIPKAATVKRISKCSSMITKMSISTKVHLLISGKILASKIPMLGS